MNNDIAWIEIFLWYNCQLHCKFCFQKDLRKKDNQNLSEKEVKTIIADGFKKWKRSIFFSWWDPCIDKHLNDYIVYAKSLWYTDIRIHTNWLILASKEIFEKYIQNGATGFIISVHGYDRIHDMLVWMNGAFLKIQSALVNFTQLKKKYPFIVLDTNTVLTRYNYTTLHVLFKFFSFFPITRSQLVQLYSLELFSLKEMKSIYVSYQEFGPYLEQIASIQGAHLTLENFPFCKVSPEYYTYITERQKYSNNAYWYIGVGWAENSYIFIDKCHSCVWREKCTWMPSDYVKVFKKENYFTF